MGKSKNNNNQNNFSGKTNFNGPTQIVAGNIINNTSDTYHQKAEYIPEALWRSPFTMAVLTWISFAIAIGGLFPLGKIIKNFVNVINGTLETSVGFEAPTYLMIFVILMILFTIFLSLRRIAKSQNRYPLFLNFAISGYAHRLTLEKIHIDKCPQCGGKMKYYNKPVEWKDTHYSDGRSKRRITKRIPVLECKQYSEHWCKVDPAEDWVN